MSSATSKTPADDKMQAQSSSEPGLGSVHQVSCTTDEPPIYKLDEFCLRLIFNYLPVLDRLRIVKVCRQWNEVAGSMWKTVQELDVINGKPFKFERKLRTLPVLKEIFKLSNIKKLKLQANRIGKSKDLIQVIATMCPKLEELVLYKVNFTPSKLTALGGLKNLKMLGLHLCNPLEDNDVAKVLKDKPVLKHLEITTSKKLRGEFLKKIRSPLETLVLAIHNRMDPSYLWDEKCLEHLTSTLQHLNLSCLWYFDCDCEIDSINERFPNLKSLTLACYEPKEETSMDDIVEMKNLESLNLSFNANINDMFIKDLVQRCKKLKHLDISGSGVDMKHADSENVFPISALNKLPNLESLNLSFLNKMPPVEITNFASVSPPIEYLYLVDLKHLKDIHVKDLFSLCRQLKHVDFSNCPGITDDTIEAANEALAKRINKLPLHLVIGGTNIASAVSLETKRKAASKKKKSGKVSQSKESNFPSVSSSVKLDKKRNHPLLSLSHKNNCTRLRTNYAYGYDNYCSDDDCDIEDCADGTKEHHKKETEEDAFQEALLEMQKNSLIPNMFGSANYEEGMVGGRRFGGVQIGGQFGGAPFPGAGAAFPGAAFPGAAFPGAAFPGAAFPGAAFPGAAFPGANDDSDEDDLTQDDDGDDIGPRVQYVKRPDKCKTQ